MNHSHLNRLICPPQLISSPIFFETVPAVTDNAKSYMAMLKRFLPDFTNKFVGVLYSAMTRTRRTNREHILCHPSLDARPYIGTTHPLARHTGLATSPIG